MMHLFKVPLQHSDLLISEITEDTISYTVRTKEEGTLLEEMHLHSKYIVNDNKALFDGRFIMLPFLDSIRAILES